MTADGRYGDRQELHNKWEDLEGDVAAQRRDQGRVHHARVQVNTAKQSRKKVMPWIESIDPPSHPGELVDWIMYHADRHSRNGTLTVNELRTFMPHHPFTAWLTGQFKDSDNTRRMRDYDVDGDGGIHLSELRAACHDYCGVDLPAEELQPDRRDSIAEKLAGLDARERELLEDMCVDGRVSTPPLTEKVEDPDMMAQWIMNKADRHNSDGNLSINELQTFLPKHPFTKWLTGQREQWRIYDKDNSGGIDMKELRAACHDYCNRNAAPQEQLGMTERLLRVKDHLMKKLHEEVSWKATMATMRGPGQTIKAFMKHHRDPMPQGHHRSVRCLERPSSLPELCGTHHKLYSMNPRRK